MDERGIDVFFEGEGVECLLQDIGGDGGVLFDFIGDREGGDNFFGWLLDGEGIIKKKIEYNF